MTGGMPDFNRTEGKTNNMKYCIGNRFIENNKIINDALEIEMKQMKEDGKI